MSDRDPPRFLDRPENVRRVLRALFLVSMLLLGLDLVYPRHVTHPWEAVWGFYAVFGFVACVLLVLIAREMRKLLMRSSRYYDEERER